MEVVEDPVGGRGDERALVDVVGQGDIPQHGSAEAMDLGPMDLHEPGEQVVFLLRAFEVASFQGFVHFYASLRKRR